MSALRGEVVVAGEAVGPLLRLTKPISFWGGVDPRTSAITDPRHPQFGKELAGAVVAVERLIGSSSASSVLLELTAAGRGPAGLILGEVDAIAALGAIVARELGHAPPAILLLSPKLFSEIPAICHIDQGGLISAI